MTDFFVIACPVCFERFTLPYGTGEIQQHECKSMNRAEEQKTKPEAISVEKSIGFQVHRHGYFLADCD
jgi:hypothetical protein